MLTSAATYFVNKDGRLHHHKCQREARTLVSLFGGTSTGVTEDGGV